MNAEIIAVGSELLLGQITNTNAQYISEQLASIGINVYYHTVVGDNPERLTAAVSIARKRADCIILTGGLGPTKDDLTKETIGGLMGKTLVYDDEALKSILSWYEATGKVMTENNRKQALVIEGSHVLLNRHGMAPGMIVKPDHILYMLLPGPPSEMRPMFADFAMPYLSNLADEPIYSRVLHYFGIGESTLETEIIDLIDAQTNPTIAPLAKDGEVTLRLSVRHASKDQAMALLDNMEHQINERVGGFFYGYDESSLPKETSSLLLKNGLTIAGAESLTGGLFSKEITDIPGSSKVFNGSVIAYTNEVKKTILNVPTSILSSEGAVSAGCAEAMASNIRSLTGSNIGISFTGVAGPEESEGKPVGTVYIGLSGDFGTTSHKYSLQGTREGIQMRSVKYGWDLIRRQLQGL